MPVDLLEKAAWVLLHLKSTPDRPLTIRLGLHASGMPVLRVMIDLLLRLASVPIPFKIQVEAWSLCRMVQVFRF